MRDPIRTIIDPLPFFPVSPKCSREGEICTNKLVQVWKLIYHSTYVDSVRLWDTALPHRNAKEMEKST